MSDETNIEREADGSLVYWIDAFDGRPQSQFADESARLEAMLKNHVGDEVYVLLLKRGPDDGGVTGAPCSAPDVVRWTLASAGRSWRSREHPPADRLRFASLPGRAAASPGAHTAGPAATARVGSAPCSGSIAGWR